MDFSVSGDHLACLPACIFPNYSVHFWIQSDILIEYNALILQTLELEETIESFSTPYADDIYHQRMTSVFTAPTTGNYTFWVFSDDHSNVYISELQASSSGLTQIIDFNSHCSHLFCSADQRSDVVHLSEGVDYLIQAEHMESGGANYFTLGMIVPGDTPAYNSLREIQDLTITMDYTYEKQKFDIPITSTVTGGFFMIHQENPEGSNWEVSISALATAAEIEAAIYWGGTISVSACTSAESNGICFEVEFQSLVAEERTLLEIRYAPEAVVCSASCGLTPATFYSATRSASGSPSLTGSFAITYADLSTSDIEWGASAETVEARLDANPLFPPGPYYVTKTDSTFSTQTYRIEFAGVPGPVFSTFNVNITGLDGGDSISTTSAAVVEGSYDRLLMPIPGYMLRTLATAPQLRVTSRGHPAECGATSCDFIPTEANTPLVTSVEEFLGPDTLDAPDDARVLVIRGSGFSSAIAGNRITVANELCRMMDVSEERLLCALPSVVTGVNEIVVNVLSKGLARHVGDTAPFIVSGPLTVSSVSPTMGSVGGGTYVTITGGVFPMHAPEQVTVTFNEAAGSGDDATKTATLVSVTSSTIVFKSPPNAELKAEYDNVVLNVAGQQHEFAFGYDEDLTPLVLSVTPDLVSAVEPTLLTIEGEGLGAAAEDVEITLAGDVCVVRSIEADGTKTTCMWYPMDNTQLINCDVQCERLIDGVPRTTHDLQYNVMDKGLTVGVPGALSVRVALEINSVVPDHGSLLGGTRVTIRGAGFGTGEFFPNTVSVGTDYPASVCDISVATLTYVECITRPVALYDQELFQEVELTIRNVPTECKYIPYEDSFYGLQLETPTAAAPETLPDLGSLGTVPSPPPYPSPPPLYPPMYKTLTFYGVGEVDIAFAREGPTENWNRFYGLAKDDAGQQVEHAFPGIDPFASRRRGLLSVSPDAADMFYGLLSASLDAPDSPNASNAPATPGAQSAPDASESYAYYGLYGLGIEENVEVEGEEAESVNPPPSPPPYPPPSPPLSPPTPDFPPPPPPYVPPAGDCRFRYSVDYTPLVSSVSPTVTTASSPITISGSNWGTEDPAGLTVHLMLRSGANDVPLSLDATAVSEPPPPPSPFALHF